MARAALDAALETPVWTKVGLCFNNRAGIQDEIENTLIEAPCRYRLGQLGYACLAFNEQLKRPDQTGLTAYVTT